MITLGRRIASARIEANLSIRALGRILGKSEGAVRNYEKDRAQPSLETLRRIAEITDKPLSLFYGEEEQPDQAQVKIGDATITADAETIERIVATLKEKDPLGIIQAGPDKGIIEFLDDADLVGQFAVSQEERTVLLSLRGGLIKSKQQAIIILTALRSH